MALKSFLKVCAATVAYGVVHSALASRQAKEKSAAVLGTRYRNALYRPFYLLQSVGTLLLLMAYVRRQETPTLYHARGWRALPFRMVQAGGLALAICAAREVGFAEIFGVRGLWQLTRGEFFIAAEPEAQGPAGDCRGELGIRGPFRWSRHPLNFVPLVVLWFNPRMTGNLLAFAVVSTVYLVLGSKHEEIRLVAAYGEPYREYQGSGIPFYVPGVRGPAVIREKSELIQIGE